MIFVVNNKLWYKGLQKEKLEKFEKGEADGIPVCAGNLSSPVIDTPSYIEEVRYRIGSKLYIENAD